MDIPVDVMMPPWGGKELIDILVDRNVNGFALNLEVLEEIKRNDYSPSKGRFGTKGYRDVIEHAVDRLGKGKVRSLLILGLENPESTLMGVEFLARAGCDPVLSPFRPAKGTPLGHIKPPDETTIMMIHNRAVELCESYGVKLGPRCIPCQHNTLTLPDGSNGYFYS